MLEKKSRSGSRACARARAAFLSSAAQSLLRALLEREPGKRLGAGLQGSEAIMAHPFFRPISWARLLRREARRPGRAGRAPPCGTWCTASGAGCEGDFQERAARA